MASRVSAPSRRPRRTWWTVAPVPCCTRTCTTLSTWSSTCQSRRPTRTQVGAGIALKSLARVSVTHCAVLWYMYVSYLVALSVSWRRTGGCRAAVRPGVYSAHSGGSFAGEVLGIGCVIFEKLHIIVAAPPLPVIFPHPPGPPSARSAVPRSV